MDSIEQAILFVSDYRRPASAVILAKTHGVQQIDEGELLGWAFDYDGEFFCEDQSAGVSPFQNINATAPAAESHLYFHPLPSGCHALCLQTASRNPSSDSISFVSHCLILTPRLLRAFHNDVLAIHQALMARADFQFFTSSNPADTSVLSLSPITIGARHTPVIDTGLLEAVRDYPGAAGFANLLSLSIHSVCTTFTWLSPSLPLIHCVIQCLPISLRPELAFATSLHFSSVRPLRLIAVHENSRKTRDVCRQFAIPYFHMAHLDETMLRERLLPHRNWATFVYHVLEQGAYDPFVRCMAEHFKSCPFETKYGTADWNMLNQAGKSLLDLWDKEGISAIGDKWREIFSQNNSASGRKTSSTIKSDKPVDAGENPLLRGDYSHERFHLEIDSHAERETDAGSSRDSALRDKEVKKPSKKQYRPSPDDKPASAGSRPASQRRLALRFAQYEHEIRQLDSLIARSLFGDARALEALEEIWRELQKRLEFQETDVIRENYIHLIQSIIVQPRDPDYPKPPRRTLDSLDVMNIFLQEK